MTHSDLVEALGPVFIVCSIPLILRWIPPNRSFGFRVPPTLDSETVWYRANALFGRHLFVLGMLMVGLEFVLPAAARIAVLRVVAAVGFIGIMIADWRTASRWRERERSGVSEDPKELK